MNIFSASIEYSQEIAKIIAISNRDVAEKFSLDKENNPKHPSFYDNDWVLSDFQRGEEYFLFKQECSNVACVAFEQPNPEIGYLNRLSVLPSYRRRGIGEELVNHIINYAKSKGVLEISIGIIANHTDLKNWYLKLGFVKNGVKEFPHLPFDVLFMKYELSD